jgi:plastocyanin
MQTLTRFLSVVLLLALGMTVPGCGGGAGATPTVRYLPSGTGEAAVADTETPAAAAAEPAAGAGFGTIKGRVVFQGNAVSLPALFAQGAASKDPTVCAAKEVIPDETVIVNSGGLANVFIYLPKAPKTGVTPAPAEPVIFDQKNCVFLPHALVVRTGQAVKVLNSDATLHNTHTYPNRNSPFNQGVQPNDSTDMVYKSTENLPFMVGCDVHPWMKAYHLPVDHPFAAVSAADGTFEIKDLPSGTHEFRVWHEKGGMLNKAQKVVVKAGETTEVEISVGATQLGSFQGPPSKVIQLSSTR